MRRFVEQDEIRLFHQAAADGEHLLFAAGQGAGQLASAFDEAGEHAEDFVHRLLRPGPRARERAAHLQVLGHREHRKDLAAFAHLANARSPQQAVFRRSLINR